MRVADATIFTTRRRQAGPSAACGIQHLSALLVFAGVLQCFLNASRSCISGCVSACCSSHITDSESCCHATSFPNRQWLGLI